MSRAARAPKGKAVGHGALAYWKTLPSDEGAHYDKVVTLDGASMPPIVTWGTSPEDVLPVTGAVPDPDEIEDRQGAPRKRALDYMGLKPGTR
jgi:3-isopropylmalate/(R)-2-methylmalate dehydratase large subunit